MAKNYAHTHTEEEGTTHRHKQDRQTWQDMLYARFAWAAHEGHSHTK